MFPFGWYHLLKALKNNEVLDMYIIAIKPEGNRGQMKSKLMKRIGSALLAFVLSFTMLPTEGLKVQAATGDVTK